MATAHSYRKGLYLVRTSHPTQLIIVFIALLFLLEDVEGRSDDDEEEAQGPVPIGLGFPGHLSMGADVKFASSDPYPILYPVDNQFAVNP
ncbi:hypothetical protein GE061_011846 [Apolygus lucorum]|uniref:Uncharacterized protein n=1 Tax=Apolygus lucorum TaxID=248454 RepID=A0A8S9Y2R1_APOLU|nr:hypothetical protein GE061_011846 [Apolygus lucorum]